MSIEEKAGQAEIQLCRHRPDNQDGEIARNIKPSERGELEIADVNRAYLKKQRLNVEVLGRGFSWRDTETPKTAGSQPLCSHHRTTSGWKGACLEKIAYINGWSSAEQVAALAEKLKTAGYGQYLKDLLSLTKAPHHSEAVRQTFAARP
nr:sugar phosphate nucleotidyltransferase [Pseudomonas juntendi]